LIGFSGNYYPGYSISQALLLGSGRITQKYRVDTAENAISTLYFNISPFSQREGDGLLKKEQVFQWMAGLV
jgi:hypothetical protein